MNFRDELARSIKTPEEITSEKVNQAVIKLYKVMKENLEEKVKKGQYLVEYNGKRSVSGRIYIGKGAYGFSVHTTFLESQNGWGIFRSSSERKSSWCVSVPDEIVKIINQVNEVAKNDDIMINPYLQIKLTGGVSGEKVETYKYNTRSLNVYGDWNDCLTEADVIIDYKIYF